MNWLQASAGMRWQTLPFVVLVRVHTMRAAPDTVCAASARALSRGSPAATAPSASASMARNTYAGPLPLSPVTASIMRSSTGMARPGCVFTVRKRNVILFCTNTVLSIRRDGVTTKSQQCMRCVVVDEQM